MSAQPITVSITTRNRPAALDRCLRSIAHIATLTKGVIVFDDASDPPVSDAAMEPLASRLGLPIDVVRADAPRGTAAGKNLIARRALTPFVLSLDDDAFLVDGRAVRAAVEVLAHDSKVAAIAFAQLDGAGVRCAAFAQPSAAMVASYVPAFIGFASLLNREHLLAIGGYREAFGIHGEERELCLRWLDRGWRVVFLPDAGVAHDADPSQRDRAAYTRLVIRNDCLNALYNDPLPRALAAIPYKLWSYTRMNAGIGGTAAGLTWVAREIVRQVPAIYRERRPVRWATLRSWARLRSTPQPYPFGAPR
jgi:GT2 family glycosyltransferase